MCSFSQRGHTDFTSLISSKSSVLQKTGTWQSHLESVQDRVANGMGSSLLLRGKGEEKLGVIWMKHAEQENHLARMLSMARKAIQCIGAWKHRELDTAGSYCPECCHVPGTLVMLTHLVRNVQRILWFVATALAELSKGSGRACLALVQDNAAATSSKYTFCTTSKKHTVFC